jgi:hypothetical protein
MIIIAIYRMATTDEVRELKRQQFSQNEGWKLLTDAGVLQKPVLKYDKGSFNGTDANEDNDYGIYNIAELGVNNMNIVSVTDGPNWWLVVNSIDTRYNMDMVLQELTKWTGYQKWTEKLVQSVAFFLLDISPWDEAFDGEGFDFYPDKNSA